MVADVLNSAMNQSEFKANTCDLCQAREITCDQDTIGFGGFSLVEKMAQTLPITNQATERSKAKSKQT